MIDLFCVLGDLRQPFLAGWLTCFAILEIWVNHLLVLDWLVLRFGRFEATISWRLIDLFCDLEDLRQPFLAGWLTCSAILEIWGKHYLPGDWLVLRFWRFEVISWFIILTFSINVYYYFAFLMKSFVFAGRWKLSNRSSRGRPSHSRDAQVPG